MKRSWFGVLLIVTLLVVAIVPAAAAAPARSQTEYGGAEVPPLRDNLPDPLTTLQQDLKKTALDAKLNGKAYGKIHEVARGQFVQLELEGTDQIWTVLGEFPDLAHNNIAEPNREVNNTSYWVPDFNREHYMDILFNDAPSANSMHNYYIEQSSGRYTVNGDVTDWVEVPGVAADYDYPQRGTAVWNFIRDSVNAWYDAQIAAGKSAAEINEYLSGFDQWDRYDYDKDKNFNEPDGYIDRFQSIHAGEGEEAGAAPWTIWSHSWYAYYNLMGDAGPDFNMMGGVQVGDSDYWVGKYVIEPEDGGVGVFTHEFGHDLGLPDLYDYGGENGTGFWTLMSSGSWIDEGKESIGNKPSHMGAWEKFQLGWLNYGVARAGKYSAFRLGPMEFNTKQTQGVFVILPEKEVITELASPYAGDYAYYSGQGNELDNSMTKSVTLPSGPVELAAKVNYEIELDWDYAYVTVNGTPVLTNLSTHTDPNGQNLGNGITGSSGGNWVDLTADLSDFAGQTVTLGFRYWTDVATVESGILIDEIQLTGFPADGAETDAGWTFEGFKVSTGTESAFYTHYYVAEFRTYKGYDNGLKVGPYYFAYPDKPDFVDHFAYQDGLLINYWDNSQLDNDTSSHLGHGLLLPVDAHPDALYRIDGKLWRNRIQTYDATFTLTRTDGIPEIHHAGVDSPVPSLPAVKVFDDTKDWYDEANPMNSVIVPDTGTMIRIVGINTQGNFMQIEIRPVK